MQFVNTSTEKTITDGRYKSIKYGRRKAFIRGIFKQKLDMYQLVIFTPFLIGIIV
jgi:hypothetical protein